MRKGSPKRWNFRIGLLGLAILAGQICVASDIADPNRPVQTNTHGQLSERLEELIRQLRQERTSYYTEKAKQEGLIEQARANQQILQDELEDIRRQESETNQQIQKYQAEVADLGKQLISRASLEEALRKHIEPFLVKETNAISDGIPYKQQERIARLEGARIDVNSPSKTSAADRLGHLWNYGQEELRLAGSSETYTARAKTAGDLSPHARFFRVGQRILGYVTEDGRQSAMWLSLPHHKGWLVITGAKQAAQIRNAVEILDRRQGPRLVTLPIALGPGSPDKENPDASP